MDNYFIVFSAGYNCEKYVENHVKSIRNQTYQNFIHIIIDDASTDSTYEKLTDLYYPNMILIRNRKNKKWLLNAVDYLDQFIKSNNDIIVQVDLDDELFHNNVLKEINDSYINNDIWCTFSRWTIDRKKSVIHGGINDLSLFKKRKFRTDNWGNKGLSHLQTFKAFLWKLIKKDDLKDPLGYYFDEAQDVAIYIPIAEMTPVEKILFLQDVQYLYNMEHSLEWTENVNDNLIQKHCKDQILKFIPYELIERGEEYEK